MSITTNPILSDFAFPPYIIMEPVRVCNARCPFCPTGLGQFDETGYMDSAVYDKIERELVDRASEVTRVSLMGYGEPLLDKHLASRIRRYKDAGIPEVAIATNVMELNPERSKELLNAGLDINKLSISTINPDKYPKIRRGLDLQQILYNAENYFRIRDEIRPQSHIFVHMERSPLINEEDVNEWKKYWISRLRPGDELKIVGLLDMAIVKTLEKPTEGGDVSPCVPMLQTVMLFFNGETSFCCFDVKGGRIRHKLGSIKEHSIEEIWNSDLAKSYRKKHRSGHRNEIDICRGCKDWSNDVRETIRVSLG